MPRKLDPVRRSHRATQVAGTEANDGQGQHGFGWALRHVGRSSFCTLQGHSHAGPCHDPGERTWCGEVNARGRSPAPKPPPGRARRGRVFSGVGGPATAWPLATRFIARGLCVSSQTLVRLAPSWPAYRHQPVCSVCTSASAIPCAPSPAARQRRRHPACCSLLVGKNSALICLAASGPRTGTSPPAVGAPPLLPGPARCRRSPVSAIALLGTLRKSAGRYICNHSETHALGAAKKVWWCFL